MGCGSSTPLDLSGSDGGFAAEQCVGGCATESSTALVVKQKFFSWSGDDFAVKDQTGATRFVVKGKVLTMRDKMVITNEAGEKVAMVQKKILSLRPTFQVYTYKPNTEGQESTEDDSGTPVYRFAMVEKQLLALTPEFCWKLYKGNEDPETKLLAKVQMSLGGMARFTMDIKVPGEGGTVLGTCGQSSMIQLQGKNTYIIEVAKGMDLLGMLCLAVAVDDMREEKNVHNAGG